MSFDVNTFACDPSKTELYSLTKPQLKLIADKLKIEYDSSAKKVELRQITVLRRTLYLRSSLQRAVVLLKSRELN